MQLLDLLNQLERDGVLDHLYKAGLVNVKACTQRDLTLHYQALLATPAYAGQPGEAARATARQYRVSARSVYRAIQDMTQAI